ncbi:dTDP-4-dehydrorhamnose reductase [Novosphingobium sp. PhB57]|uniref:dTDP-4-dehydrorhamnose reductase n=1 Tax=Novosphingobium sp. PhB57 TaxID=2485107 RepID=UPI001050E819|nr:dTDP-4-dehydrorhamnose reductase [Novosphingobium sp. PhB57]
MRIAVTGCLGQVVSALRERAAKTGHEVIALGRPMLDLLAPATVLPALKTAMPDVVVSAAAYTAVDQAEIDAPLAHATNTAGAEIVAWAARHLGVPLIHLSTDYVFDGSLDRPYMETDQPSPMGTYGASKLAGEHAVLAVHGANAAILRTAWIYSPFGRNFVKTMLMLAKDHDEISIVSDQLGNPTSALDIADGIITVALNLINNKDPLLRGVFHIAALGDASWADLALAVFRTSAMLGASSVRVNRITSTDRPALASRPANSRLNCELISNRHGVILPNWHDSLETVVRRLSAVTV